MKKRYFGVIIFIILCITTVSVISILIARGYKFTGGEIKENGIINIISNPPGAKIFVNGEEKAVTPGKIELTSGKYELKITKDNHREWKKEIFVEASIVTDIIATLFPTKLDLEQLTFSSIDKVFFSSDGDIAVYIINKKPNPGIWLIKLEKTIFELSSPQPTKILEIDALPKHCVTGGSYEVKISTDNAKAIYQCNFKDYSIFYLLDLRNSTETLETLNEEIGFNPSNVFFSFNSENLFVIDNEIIANYNIGTKEFSLISRKRENYQPLLTPFGNEFLLLEYSYDTKHRKFFTLTADLRKIELDQTGALEEEDISNISGSNKTQDLFAYTTEKASYIFNLKQTNGDASLPFSENKVETKSWTFEELSFLFKEGKTLKTAEIKNAPNGTLRVKTYKVWTKYNPSEQKVSWANNSQQLLINDTSQKKIYALDIDGSNKSLLYEGELTHPESFKLSKNETFLVLLLEDEDGYSNLYSVKLKI